MKPVSYPPEAQFLGERIAELMVKTIAGAGVKRFYGIVGDSLNRLTEALRKQTTVECVLVRYEEVAAFAVPAEAH
jgi:pyruvate dehydrogenase (quinone)